METLLSELAQYHYPELQPHMLLKEPYLPFTEKYCSIGSELIFYRGYHQLDPIQRAQVYRALNLACDEHFTTRNFMIFTSEKGLTLRVKPSPLLQEIDARFEHFLKSSSDQIFIPEGYDRLSENECPYYTRLLQIFRKTLSVSSRLITVPEYSSTMIFLSLSSSKHLQKKWRAFLEGRVERILSVSPFQVKSALELYPWGRRQKFSQKSSRFSFSVLEMFPEEFESRQQQLREIPGDLSLRMFELGETLEDERQVVGLLRILSKHWPDQISEMIPLLGTSKLILPYTSKIDEEKIQRAISEYSFERIPDEGIEIFTQQEFSEMSRFERANLIQAPSGNWYSFLDLIQNPPVDPLTREEFSEEFREELKQIRSSIECLFWNGFPEKRFEPELFTVSDCDLISFYIRLSPEQTFLFWKTPSTDQGLVDKATSTLVLKWTDGSLFGKFKDTCLKYGLDPGLIFSPKVYSIFREFLENPGIRPCTEKSREQLEMLSKI